MTADISMRFPLRVKFLWPTPALPFTRCFCDVTQTRILLHFFSWSICAMDAWFQIDLHILICAKEWHKTCTAVKTFYPLKIITLLRSISFHTLLEYRHYAYVNSLFFFFFNSPFLSPDRLCAAGDCDARCTADPSASPQTREAERQPGTRRGPV